MKLVYITIHNVWYILVGNEIIEKYLIYSLNLWLTTHTNEIPVYLFAIIETFFNTRKYTDFLQYNMNH